MSSSKKKRARFILKNLVTYLQYSILLYNQLKNRLFPGHNSMKSLTNALKVAIIQTVDPVKKITF